MLSIGIKKIIKNKLTRKKSIQFFGKGKKSLIKDNVGGLRTLGIFKKDLKNNPLITIIMPNFKSKNLLKSIKSILNQSYK